MDAAQIVPRAHTTPGAEWRECRATGAAVPFAPVQPQDDYLHGAPADADFTHIETNLYGFNIPEAAINCSIYVLWHPLLKTMSAHVFVVRGDRFLDHQLECDYFIEHLFLPAVDDIADWSVAVGGWSLRITLVEPLNAVHIRCEDPDRGFAFDLYCRAALPPVGRPGGHHFTQLLRTSGSLLLDGERYVIHGYYMRDRSWGYARPEQAERAPPYRWMTGWFGGDCGFVIAWLDTGLLDDPAFGPHWDGQGQGADARGVNKWESGGPTPSLNLRSGWIAVDGEIVQVTNLTFRTRTAAGSRFKTAAVDFALTDVTGRVHRITGRARSMVPKMYWGNLLTYMHAMELTLTDSNGDEHSGAGDLMDTYSGHHIRKYGL